MILQDKIFYTLTLAVMLLAGVIIGDTATQADTRIMRDYEHSIECQNREINEMRVYIETMEVR